MVYVVEPVSSSSASAPVPVKRRATARFMFSHPAHVLALGFGSGLSPKAPGTVGTLWAWVFYLIVRPLFGDFEFGLFLAASFVVGWWACTVTARNLNQPGSRQHRLGRDPRFLGDSLARDAGGAGRAGRRLRPLSLTSTRPSQARSAGPIAASSCGRAAPSVGRRASASSSDDLVAAVCSVSSSLPYGEAGGRSELPTPRRASKRWRRTPTR